MSIFDGGEVTAGEWMPMRSSSIVLPGILLSSLLLMSCTGSGSGGSSSSSNSSTSSSGVVGNANIEVSQPMPNTVVTSPLTVTGRARGTWYFEASFPVRLLDHLGNEIAVTPAQAQGDWMTTDFVPFQATLTFMTTSTTGTLVLEKDNPSGEPQNDASILIPVKF